ncbi:MAG: 16S rRNA (uracil(1498)-N(3))-methyltransferase [Alphaproteobacteria bacterium]|nr:16S rRNA (uracil(1498)-N(3))-methyltransferase [Alphaproteobacteria bacterium]
MIRLFVQSPLKTGVRVVLDEKSSHYLVHVMRCHSNDELLCFNGMDGEWLCQLELPAKKQGVLSIKKQIRKQEPTPFCALCPALIKKDNMDLVFQKATELGVSDIYPLITDHTVHSHLNRSHAESIIKEAAEQCERLSLPILHEPTTIKDLKKSLPKDCEICCLSEREGSISCLPTDKKMAFVIGPEGGWSTKEKAFFRDQKFMLFHSDVGILRAETASIAILAHWQFLKHKK